MTRSKSTTKAAGLERGSRALYERPRYYDHAYRTLKADVAFYTELARDSGGPVLELGAGTGRITLGIARAGVDVVGLDQSAAMLARAKERIASLPAEARQHIELRQGDLRKVRLRRRFALVIAPFNLFMHMFTRADIEQALATVQAHLAPRGRFAMDVLMPDLGTLRRDPERVYRCRPVFDPTDGKRYAYGESFDYDSVSQVQTVRMMFQRIDRPELDHTTPLCLRFYFPEELLALLHYNGFTLEQRFGGFDKSPFTEQSDNQVLVARPSRRR
ncbi:MAG TPA: class I SAM-dependent methyltransferase [Polyangiales bacterium]